MKPNTIIIITVIAVVDDIANADDDIRIADATAVVVSSSILYFIVTI